jgi:hypothetical protein
MLLEIGVILLVLWLLGFSLNLFGGLIHIILVIAAVLIIWHFITGQKLI